MTKEHAKLPWRQRFKIPFWVRWFIYVHALTTGLSIFYLISYQNKLASTRDYGTYSIVKQIRLWRACPNANLHLSLCCLHTQSMDVDKDLDQSIHLQPCWICQQQLCTCWIRTKISCTAPNVVCRTNTMENSFIYPQYIFHNILFHISYVRSRNYHNDHLLDT